MRISSLSWHRFYLLRLFVQNLGFAIILAAWALALASPLTLLGVVAFVLYMNRFQVAPEEWALEALFGESFVRYRAQVRRWL